MKENEKHIIAVLDLDDHFHKTSPATIVPVQCVYALQSILLHGDQFYRSVFVNFVIYASVLCVRVNMCERESKVHTTYLKILKLDWLNIF